MPTIPPSLLLKSKDTHFGVTRDTIKALASELDVTETQVIHVALSRLADETLPAYAPDDGPLTVRQIASVRKTLVLMPGPGKLCVPGDIVDLRATAFWHLDAKMR